MLTPEHLSPPVSPTEEDEHQPLMPAHALAQQQGAALDINSLPEEVVLYHLFPFLPLADRVRFRRLSSRQPRAVLTEVEETLLRGIGLLNDDGSLNTQSLLASRAFVENPQRSIRELVGMSPHVAVGPFANQHLNRRERCFWYNGIGEGIIFILGGICVISAPFILKGDKEVEKELYAITSSLGSFAILAGIVILKRAFDSIPPLQRDREFTTLTSDR